MKFGGWTFIVCLIIAVGISFVLIEVSEGGPTAIDIMIYPGAILFIGLLMLATDFIKHGEVIKIIVFTILGCLCTFGDPLQFMAYVFFAIALMIFLHTWPRKIKAACIGILVLYALGVGLHMSVGTVGSDYIHSVIAMLTLGYFIKAIEVYSRREVIEYIEVRTEPEKDAMIKDMQREIEALEQYKSGYQELMGDIKRFIKQVGA